MGKYKGLFWPAILGVKHMPKVKESEFYNVAGGFRRATINDKIAFFLQHPVWEGRPELFMKTGSPKEIYAMSGMSVHGLCNLIGQPAQAQSIVDGFNYVVEQKGLKKVHFISGLYAEDEVRRDPDKGKVQGIDYSAVSVEKARKVNADAIAAGVDAKDGMVAIQGWEQVSTVTATDLCLKMKEYGVKHIIYTDISRDGMLSGPNIPATKKLTEETGLDIIASGGVSCMEDLQALYDAGISGAIMGKALYEKRVDLEEAVRRFEK